MANKVNESSSRLSEYLQNVLDGFVKSKNEYLEDKEENTRLRKVNSLLQLEIQEAQEQKKSLRYDLSTCREIISSLQESVSNLMPFKRDMKKLTLELDAKDKIIASVEEEKEKLEISHKAELQALEKTFEQQMEVLTFDCEAKNRDMEKERDTEVALYTCQVVELNSKITDLEKEFKEKTNMIVLDYEERLQRASSQLTQLRDQHAGLVARTDTDIQTYRRRLDELNEKLKQNEFKQFISSNPVNAVSPMHTTYEPSNYAADPDISVLELEFQKPRTLQPARSMNQLQVLQIPVSKSQNKTFNIVKKRKLYSDKDFQ